MANPRGRGDVIFRQLDDEWVIFDPTTYRLHALNLTAALVWEHCTGDLSVEQIAHAVAGAFDAHIDRAAVVGDVRVAVGRFQAEGLLG